MGRAGVFEYLMKHIHLENEEQALLEILPQMKHIEQVVDQDFIVRCLEDLATKGNVSRLLEIAEEHFGERTQGETMTTVKFYAEKARQEALATVEAREDQAREQTKEQIARNMRDGGFDSDTIFQMTGIDPAQLD